MGLVACAVFKTVGRRLWRLRWVRSPHAPANAGRWLVVALALQLPAAAAAQVPIPIPQRQDTSRADTVKVPPFRVPPPIPPLGAMWRSMLLPGWGQSVLGRRVTGAVFVFWEGLTLTMTLKASSQLRYMRANAADSAAVNAKKQEVQDWAVLLAFNHLFAGAEAFVSAQLWDFPTELGARALPHGNVGIGIRVGWPNRETAGGRGRRR